MSQRRIPEIEGWPHCPQCRAPRTTYCPICQTAGVDFLQVDPQYAAAPDDGSEARAMSCACDSGDCSSAPCENPADEPLEEFDSQEAATGVMVLCPTCDEPFVPEHPNRCEWCGHPFPDGYTVDVAGEAPEQFNTRVVGAMLGLAVILLALAVYFAFLF